MTRCPVTDCAAQPWAINPMILQGLLGTLSRASAIKESYGGTASLQPLKVEGHKAIVPIKGILLKTAPPVLRHLFGGCVTGYDGIREMVSRAVTHDDVARIELRIESPGGEVLGVMETTALLREAGRVKPLTAVVEDLAAGTAYWLATAAPRIGANANAEIGSIGVYRVFTDVSKHDEKAGVKTIVVRSGEHKGVGFDRITSEQLAAVQEVIDGLAGHFIEQVVTGRRMSLRRACELATGRIWLAPAALKLGLIDFITRG